MTSIATTNTNTPEKVIDNYYDTRMKLRMAYSKIDTNVLLDAIQDEVSKQKLKKIISNIDIESYSIRFTFIDRDSITPKIESKIISIVTSIIQSTFKINVDYLDNFKLGDSIIIFV